MYPLALWDEYSIAAILFLIFNTVFVFYKKCVIYYFLTFLEPYTHQITFCWIIIFQCGQTYYCSSFITDSKNVSTCTVRGVQYCCNIVFNKVFVYQKCVIYYFVTLLEPYKHLNIFLLLHYFLVHLTILFLILHRFQKFIYFYCDEQQQYCYNIVFHKVFFNQKICNLLYFDVFRIRAIYNNFILLHYFLVHPKVGRVKNL